MILLLDKNEELTRSIDCYSITRTRELNGENSIVVESNEEILEGDRIVFKDELDKWNEYIVNSVEIVHDEYGLTYEAFCENSSYELYHFYVDDLKPRKESLSTFLSRLLENTRFDVGKIDVNETISANFYHTNVREALYKTIEKLFCDIDFTIDVKDSKIISRKVNIYKNMGNNEGVRLSYKKDLSYLKKSIDYSNICSKLYGYGRGEEIEKNEGESAYGRRINFAEINNGLKYVTNDETRLKYGIGKTRQHIEGIYVLDECEDKTQLLELTKEELQRRSEPRVSYELRVEDNSQYLNNHGVNTLESLGDKVLVVDSEIGVKVDLRVLKIIDYPHMKKDRIITLGEKPRDISVEFIKINKIETELYDVTKNNNSTVDVINDLTSGGVNVPLSAEQGKILNEKYDKLFQSANDGKNKIASAIVGKGIEAHPNDTFKDLAEKIGQIEAVKKLGYFKGDVLTSHEVKVDKDADIKYEVMKNIENNTNTHSIYYVNNSIYCIGRRYIPEDPHFKDYGIGVVEKRDVDFNLIWSIDESVHVGEHVIDEKTGVITFLSMDEPDLYLKQINENGVLTKKSLILKDKASRYDDLKLVRRDDGNFCVQVNPNRDEDSTIYMCDLNLNLIESFTLSKRYRDARLVGSFYDKLFFTERYSLLYTFDLKGNKTNRAFLEMVRFGEYMVRDKNGIMFLPVGGGCVIVNPNGEISNPWDISWATDREAIPDGFIHPLGNGEMYFLDPGHFGWTSAHVRKRGYFGESLGSIDFPLYYDDKAVSLNSVCFDKNYRYMWAAFLSVISADGESRPDNEFFYNLVKFKLYKKNETYTIIKDKDER